VILSALLQKNSNNTAKIKFCLPFLPRLYSLGYKNVTPMGVWDLLSFTVNITKGSNVKWK